MIAPVNFVCIDNCSVIYTPEVIRSMFSEVAVTGHVFVHYHADPKLRLEEPTWWAKNGSQTVWISIQEWADCESAFKTIEVLAAGCTSFIRTKSNSVFLEIQKTDFNDMVRFPIDLHSNPTEISPYRLDRAFDSVVFQQRKHFMPAPVAQRRPRSEVLTCPDFVFRPICMTLIHPDLCTPSDRPFVITIEENEGPELDEIQPNKRQRCDGRSEVNVYNFKF